MAGVGRDERTEPHEVGAARIDDDIVDPCLGPEAGEGQGHGREEAGPGADAERTAPRTEDLGLVLADDRGADRLLRDLRTGRQSVGQREPRHGGAVAQERAPLVDGLVLGRRRFGRLELVLHEVEVARHLGQQARSSLPVGVDQFAHLGDGEQDRVAVDVEVVEGQDHGGGLG